MWLNSIKRFCHLIDSVIIRTLLYKKTKHYGYNRKIEPYREGCYSWIRCYNGCVLHAMFGYVVFVVNVDNNPV